jgi:hypothetical protein
MSTAQKVRRYATAVAAILSCLLVGEAKADFTSGNQLWDACQGEEAKDPIKATFCVSYIVGAGETFQALQVTKTVTEHRKLRNTRPLWVAQAIHQLVA